MIIYVKAKKDRDTLMHLNKKYSNSLIIKKFEEFNENYNDYEIFLVGKNESIEIDETPTRKIWKLKKSRVRHVRLRALINEIEKAKSRFLLDIFFDGEKYVYGKRSNFLEYEPCCDVYFCFKEQGEILEKIIKRKIFPSFILHKPDKEIFYKGVNPMIEISRSLSLEFNFKILKSNGTDFEIEKSFESKRNQEYLKKKIEVETKKFKKIASTFDEIVIPWSGGKDSTAVIVLAKNYFKTNFTTIFVDTGLEFENTLEYIEKIKKLLKIKVEIVNARIDESLKKFGKNFLTERKCTFQKVSSLYDFIRENFSNPLILTGDRISESISRSFRPQFRKDEFYVYSPIKYWSFLDIQLLFHLNNIPFNKLYEKGFYRIGCKVCPFIDSFEKLILSFLLK